MPGEERVWQLLESAGALCIRGNHEEMLLGNLPLSEKRDTVYRLAEAQARLSARRRSWIEQWPIQRELVVDGARVLLVHGSPVDPLEGYVYPDSDLTSFRSLPHDAVLMGHTHRPFIATSGAVGVVNVGSSGLPRDVGNLASCATYDTNSKQSEILRVSFDAATLRAALAGRIDASVAACLERTGPFIGRVIHD